MQAMWPPEALDFLRDLEDNNDSAWFRANRSRYDEYLLAPARCLADGLQQLGEPHFFRPYRDTRFRPGPPIKEELSFVLVPGTGGAYYVNLSLDGLIVAAGMHMPQSDQLERFRLAIDDARRAAAFERAVKVAEAAGLTAAEPELKRPPRGFPGDHPRLHRLRLKRLTVHRRHELTRRLHQPACATDIRAELEAARPLMRWLATNVGPTTRLRPR
jgi:uncharacterized protein (TIGR02453 family)